MMRLRFVCLLSSAIALTASAQTSPSVQKASPIMDMIENAKNSLNNLQYTQARTAAREILSLKLKRSQEIAALQLAAAAYYPDEPGARMTDSASMYLRRLARLMPVGGFPADLVSPALDSQFILARRVTFGASALAPLQLKLNGTESRPSIQVFSTRPARWQLFLVSEDGPAILLDTLAATTNGRFSIRAHSGIVPLIKPGDHELQIISISAAGPDTIRLRFDASATGVVPILVGMPAPPDEAKFLPERATRAIGAGIAGGLIIGGATWALANSLRPPESLGKEPKDGRATVVAVGISLGALAAGIFDHGKPLPQNIKANAAVRTNYLKQLGDATETNRKRVGEYSVALTIDPEIR